jgi:hypothetical protein
MSGGSHSELKDRDRSHGEGWPTPLRDRVAVLGLIRDRLAGRLLRDRVGPSAFPEASPEPIWPPKAN